MKYLLQFNDTLLFLDALGHTPKSMIEYKKHESLDKLRVKVRQASHKYAFEILEKPVTIVNKSNFDQLSEVITKSQEMWDRLGYWNDNILFRSGSYTTKQGLFSTNFENRGISENIEKLKSLIHDAGSPDQFLLHPLPSDSVFKKYFFATRCYMIDGVAHFEVGHGGINQIWQLEQADMIINGQIQNELKLDVSKGNLTAENKKILKSLAHGLFEFCLNAPGILVPKRISGTRPLVYEFKTFYIPQNHKTILEFSDYEIFE